MKKKILIIDDDKDLRDYISDILTEKGFEVVTAINGKDGLSKLDKSDFDLVITDIQMPELDGVGFYQLALKKHSYLRNRFLFMTGAHFTEPESWPFHHMDLNFLKKPFTLKELLGKVDILISLKKG